MHASTASSIDARCPGSVDTALGTRCTRFAPAVRRARRFDSVVIATGLPSMRATTPLIRSCCTPASTDSIRMPAWSEPADAGSSRSTTPTITTPSRTNATIPNAIPVPRAKPIQPRVPRGGTGSFVTTGARTRGRRSRGMARGSRVVDGRPAAVPSVAPHPAPGQRSGMASVRATSHDRPHAGHRIDFIVHSPASAAHADRVRREVDRAPVAAGDGWDRSCP